MQCQVICKLQTPIKISVAGILDDTLKDLGNRMISCKSLTRQFR